MTWVKLSDTFAIQPRWDELSVDAFATHVAGMCDCAQKLTDGHLTDRAVRRLPIVADPEAAAKELVAAGVWEKTEAGYLIVDYLADQELAADVQERAETKRLYDKEFKRDQRKAAKLGLLVKAYRAQQAEAAGMTVDDWLKSQRTTVVHTTVVRPSYDIVVPDPPRPDPARPGPKGQGAGQGQAVASHHPSCPWSSVPNGRDPAKCSTCASMHKGKPLAEAS